MQFKLITTVPRPIMCVTVLRIAVVLLFHAAACEGLCLYPSSWKSGSWWTAYSYKHSFQVNHTHIKTFTRARETNSHQIQSDGETFIDRKKVCHEDYKVNPFKSYYVRRHNDDEDVRECVQVYQKDKLMLQSIIPPAVVYACGFGAEAPGSMCGMTSSVRTKLYEPFVIYPCESCDTGPSAGIYDTGFYVRSETLYASQPMRAKLTTPTIDYEGRVCIRFAFNIWLRGADRDYLRVNLIGERDELFYLETIDRLYQKDLPDRKWEWRSVEATLASYKKQIEFDAIRTDYKIEGDFGIDKLTVEKGGCLDGGIRNKDMLVDSCMSRDTDYQLPVSIFVKRPWVFTATCPFPGGRYHVTITDYRSQFRHCQQWRHPTSRITVDTNAIIIRSCHPRSDVENPYNNVVLSCVGNVPASAIGSSPAKGDVLVLAYRKRPFSDTIPFFYAVRYRQYGNGTIHMSLQGNRDGKLQPDKNKGFDSSGNHGNIFTRELLLKADQCNDAYEQCQNGATCEDTPSGSVPYRCVCAPGYTGAICQSEIDHCEQKDCNQHGTCKNFRIHYTCDCNIGYTGQDCESEIDLCGTNTCSNKGTCKNLKADYKCDCVAGYTGKDCESEIDECVNVFCSNNGLCQDGVAEYICRCHVGFTGKDCETKEDCNTYAECQNSATCEDTLSGSKPYGCVCQPGYTGTHCQSDIDECVNVFCSNNGLCQDGVAGYTCTCNEGFTGKDCELKRDYCDGEDCNRHGLCSNLATSSTSYKCDCLCGYTGKDCETDIDECQNENCSGHGRCEDLLNDYRCHCDDGFTGRDCAGVVGGSGKSEAIVDKPGGPVDEVGELDLSLGPAAAVFGQDPGAIEQDGRTTAQLQSGGSSSTGLVVGLVVAALFVAAVIAVVVYRVRKSRPGEIPADEMRAIDEVRS